MGAKENVTLVKAEFKRCFKDWYLYLVYEYDDESGKHRRIYPHVIPPFFINFLPEITGVKNDDLYAANRVIRPDREMVLKPAYPIGDDVPAKKWESVFENDPGYAYDILIEEAPKEMTITDIQNILGYKIKIVDGDDTQKGWAPYPKRG